MPQRAFVPVPLIEAQPRIYKAFRGRQLRGILLGTGGAMLGLLLFGLHDPIGYLGTFVVALPGFAYGYFQPHGKPVEYWLRVWWRFYTSAQMLTASPQGLRPRLVTVLEAAIANRFRGSIREERRIRGQR